MKEINMARKRALTRFRRLVLPAFVPSFWHQETRDGIFFRFVFFVHDRRWVKRERLLDSGRNAVLKGFDVRCAIRQKVAVSRRLGIDQGGLSEREEFIILAMDLWIDRAASVLEASRPGGQMKVPDFIYIIYIRADPERVWKALSAVEDTKLYFSGVAFVSTWKPGAALFVRDGAGQVRRWGDVLRVEEPCCLSYSFDGEVHGQEYGKHRSVATFSLTPHGEGTRLRLQHSEIDSSDLEEREDTFRGLNNGWPAILSSFKSLLETGRAFRFEDADARGEYRSH
jgi:uncharacterized protein YndB with AHSA1/START domain